MMHYQRVARAIGKLCGVATLMVAGAWLLAT
jgi:hypothetical protein